MIPPHEIPPHGAAEKQAPQATAIAQGALHSDGVNL